MKVVKELAYVQAELSKPSEFDKLGCIYRKETGAKEFYVGKMVTIPSGCTKEDQDRQQYLGPYSTLPELWEKRIEREFHFSSQNWKSLNSSEDLSSHLAKNIDPDKANPVEFGEIMQLLSGLVTLFSPPEEFSTLCIQHSDLAIRNVLFDENTLKITGVIDWEFASVMPIVITGRFPNDLGWEGNQFAKSLGKLGPFLEGEVWNHHYYDWTSLKGVTPPACSDPPSPPASPDYILQREDYLTSQNATANGCLPQTPESEFFCEEGALSPPSPPLPPPPTSETSQQDLTSRASNLVELQYLRKFYASKVASRDFELTRLFIDSVAYIKFNEIVMGGAEKWFISADWIKEVFWRLRAEDRTTRAKLARGGGVVVLPEVFHQQCSRRQEVDLGEWEVQPKRLRQHIG